MQQFYRQLLCFPSCFTISQSFSRNISWEESLLSFQIHQLQKLPRRVKTKSKHMSLYLHLKQATQTTESSLHLLSTNKAFSSTEVWRWLINQPTIFYVKCLQKEDFGTENTTCPLGVCLPVIPPWKQLHIKKKKSNLASSFLCSYFLSMCQIFLLFHLYFSLWRQTLFLDCWFFYSLTQHFPCGPICRAAQLINQSNLVITYLLFFL